MSEVSDYLLHLLCCALDEKKPQEKPDGADWQQIFSFAVFHSVANLAFYSVERLENKPDEQLMNKWRKLRDLSIVRSITQLYEAKNVSAALARENIRYMILKGTQLKGIYPKEDHREMSDIDILVDPDNVTSAAAAIRTLGYEESFVWKYETGLVKKPHVCIELHSQLMPDTETLICDYFKDIWERSLPDGEKGRRMTDEDFYLYMTAHLYKHYRHGGTGIRSIMDIHVFLKKRGESLDRGYINDGLEKMGLSEFERDARRLADMWFGGKSCGGLEKMSEFVLSSGTYGSSENKSKNEIEKLREKNARFVGARYMFTRVFRPFENMAFRYPILRKFPVLLPIFTVHRWIDALIHKRSTIKKQLKAAAGKNDD
ncbi:MAG: nucleotidyltransferase family protein [Oscillospiraceae bacterium]